MREFSFLRCLISWRAKFTRGQREMFFQSTVSENRTANYIGEALKAGIQNAGAPLSNNSILGNVLSRLHRAKIIGMALGYVMSQRAGDKCSDKELAYADHYLQARLMVAYLGPSSVALTQTVVIGYEAKKKIYEELGILNKMASDSNCPEPVHPDLTSVQWGLMGADDGKIDFMIDFAENAGELIKDLFNTPNATRLPIVPSRKYWR